MEKCCPKMPERSKAVEMVFSQVRDLMRRINDIDGIEKQQAMAMQLFKFLGSAKDLETIAQKLMQLALASDKKEVEEEIKEKDESMGILDDLYIKE